MTQQLTHSHTCYKKWLSVSITMSEKVKVALKQSMKVLRGAEGQLYSFFNLGAGWGGWLTPRPGSFTRGKETRCPLYRTMGEFQRRSGQAQNLSLTGIRSPDRPARSESLYRPHSNEYGTLVERYWRGETELRGQKPSPVPLCSPHPK